MSIVILEVSYKHICWFHVESLGLLHEHKEANHKLLTFGVCRCGRHIVHARPESIAPPASF